MAPSRNTLLSKLTPPCTLRLSGDRKSKVSERVPVQMLSFTGFNSIRRILHCILNQSRNTSTLHLPVVKQHMDYFTDHNRTGWFYLVLLGNSCNGSHVADDRPLVWAARLFNNRYWSARGIIRFLDQACAELLQASNCHEKYHSLLFMILYQVRRTIITAIASAHYYLVGISSMSHRNHPQKRR